MGLSEAIGGFLAGLGIAGTIGGILVGVGSFIYMVIALYSPVINFLMLNHISGFLALILYIAFAVIILPTVASILGFSGGLIIGLAVGIIGAAIGALIR